MQPITLEQSVEDTKDRKKRADFFPLFHSLSKSSCVVSLWLLQGASSAASQTCSYTESLLPANEGTCALIPPMCLHHICAISSAHGFSPITVQALCYHLHKNNCVMHEVFLMIAHYRSLAIIMHLVPFAFAQPAATFLDIVERQVEALPHPIPVTSHLHQTSSEGQTACLLCSLVV